MPAHQLQGELAISVPSHRHPRGQSPRAGWGICRFTHTSQACRTRPRTTRHAAPTPESSLRGHCSQNRVGSDVASPATVRLWVDGPGAGDDGPPAAGEGTMLPAHQLQGELAISVQRHRHLRATVTAGRMGHLEVYTHVTGVPRPSAHNAARSPDPPKLLDCGGLGRRLTCNGATVG